MAKKKKRTGTGITRTRTVQVPVRSGGATSAAKNAAREEAHTIAAVVASGILGYAQKENMLDTVPHVEALGLEGTLGVAAWVGGRYMKSKILSHVATGLLSVAAYKLANEGGTAAP